MPKITSKRVLYPKASGGLNILIPCECGLTIEQIIEKDLPKENGTTIEHVVLENENFNIDFSFLEAYIFHPVKGYDFNSIIAKDIWRSKLEEAKEETLKNLDILFVRALEANDLALQNEIKQRKIALREITGFEINGSTPEEIKSFWPEILGPKPEFI